jgi:hypothetical protein
MGMKRALPAHRIHRAKPSPMFLVPFLVRAFPIVFLATGCGSVGAPQPPSLNLPAPVADLTATRTDSAVRLAWTMPKRTTDRVVLERPIPVRICRKLGDGPCTAIATIMENPDKPGAYTDNLPPDLASGPWRLLTYQVILLNRAQKSAGSSNSAVTAAGAAPPAVAGLAAQVRQDGVLLSWHPATNAPSGEEKSTVFRIHRVLTTPGGEVPPGNSSPFGKAEKPPAEVTLAVRVASGADPGHALDTNAQLNQQYRYTVERVAVLSLARHEVEIQGQASDPLAVTATDIFPPAAPKNVVAVADAVAGAIDLSWPADTEPDLAGYYVYRRDTGTSLPAQRVGPLRSPIATPSFRDTNVERGHTYAYSVSAIDRSGNESTRSQEAVETVPSQ